jgi:hypothetical protein
MATERKRHSPAGKCLAFRKLKKERIEMSNNNNNQINIPQAREAMDRFKMQAAQEVGVNLTNGYNGHLTSREAGSVGGQMVKKMCPVRIAKFDRNSRTAEEYIQKVVYVATITI